MKRQELAYIYGMLAVFLWSTVASAFKLSLRYVGYVHLLFYSSLTSLTVFFLILLFQGKLRLLRENPKSHFRSVILGFLNPFLYYLVLFKAYSLLPAQEAQALNYTWPIMLALLSIPLLKQRVTTKNIIGILTSFFGVLIISTRGDVFSLHFANPLGSLLALSSAIIWALYWIFNLRDERDDLLRMFLNFTFGFIYTALVLMIFSGFYLSPLKGTIGSVYVGLFEMGITFLVWLKALRLSKTTAQIANLIYLTPFLSLVIIHFAVGEKILPSTLLGLGFIVGGIIIGRSK